MANDNPYGITVGINPAQGQPAFNFPNWTLLLADMATLGTTWLRFQVDWSLIQLNQTDPPASFAWGPLDDAVSHANAAGLHICFPVRGAPSWALTNPLQRATNETPGNSPNGDGYYLPDPTMTATFGQQVAQRYNGTTINPATGQPYGYLAALEFGNELYNIHTTSNTGGWSGIYNSKYALYNGIGGVTAANKSQPARDGHFHVSVLKTGYSMIKAVSPSCLVVMAAMWWVQPANPGGVPNTPVSNYYAFLQGLYDEGCKGFFDVVNFHYYTNTATPQQGNHQTIAFSMANTTPTQAGGALGDIQSVLLANGEPHKPVWMTEFGWQALVVNTTSSTAVPGAGSFPITVASSLNIFKGTKLQIDGGAASETLVVSAISGNQVTLPFTTAHSGTYTVTSPGDAPVTGPDSCPTRLSYVLDTARTSGVVTKLFYFTLNYSQTPASIGLGSLVQWGYNQAPPTSYVRMPTYGVYQSYISSHPSWGSTSGTRVRDIVTRLNLSATVGTFGRTRDIGVRLNLLSGGGGGGGGGGIPFGPAALVTLTDSIAQAIHDYTTTFVSSSSSAAVQALAVILSNLAGQGSQQTIGRLLAVPHPLTRELLLLAGTQVVTNVSSLITEIESLLPFYQQFYPLMDGLEQSTGGFALYLASYANSLGFPAYGLVNANFAAVFNGYAAQALTLGYIDGDDPPPQFIPNWLIFPNADVTPLYTFTTGAGSAMLYQMQGTTMSPFGGGSAPFYLYKTSGGNAAGGATFTITFSDGFGIPQAGTYTTSLSLVGSASLYNGAVQLPGIAGSSVLSVSGTDMVAGEQYAIGAKLVRASQY